METTITAQKMQSIFLKSFWLLFLEKVTKSFV